MELIERRISYEYRQEYPAIPLVQMYGCAGDFTPIFIDREFGDDAPNMAAEQFWESNAILPQFRESNVMAQDSFNEDEDVPSEEDSDFDDEICISELPLEAGFGPERNDVGPPDEREWWSAQRRWF